MCWGEVRFPGKNSVLLSQYHIPEIMSAANKARISLKTTGEFSLQFLAKKNIRQMIITD